MSETTQNPEVIPVHEDYECCPDWKPQTDILNGPIVLQTVRSDFKYQYPGKPIAYCPWCGKKRP